MDRRDFLRFLAFGLATPLVWNASGCSTLVTPKKQKSAAGSRGKIFLFLNPNGANSGTLRILDWDSYAFTDIGIPLTYPHSLLQSKENPEDIYLFEMGGSCLKLNLKTKAMILLDHRRGKEIFRGHGIQSPSEEFIFCTQRGPRFAVGIKSAKTMETIGFAPHECDNAHHIASLPHSPLAVCGNLADKNGKTGGGITFWNCETRKVLQSVDLGCEILHVFPIGTDEVVGLGISQKALPRHAEHSVSSGKSGYENASPLEQDFAYEGAPLFHVKLDGSHKAFWNETEKDLFKLSFGLVNAPDGVFLTTHRQSNRVILWKDFKIAASIEVPFPTQIAISEDASEFIVKSDRAAKIFSLETMQEVKTIPNILSVLSNYRQRLRNRQAKFERLVSDEYGEARFLRFLAFGLATPLVWNATACSRLVSRPVAQAGAKPKGKVFLFLDPAGAESGILRIWDWDNYSSVDFPVPLTFPHSLIQSKDNPDEIYIFELDGSCLKLNLQTMKMIVVSHRDGKEIFGGHAIQSQSGEFIFCTQLVPRHNIGIKSAKTLRTIEFAPEDCADVHHITALPQSSIAACGNMKASGGGRGGGITFLDCETRKVVNKVDLGCEIFHLYPIAPDEVVALGVSVKTLDRHKRHTISADKSGYDNGWPLLEHFAYDPAPLFHVKLDGSHKAFWNPAEKDWFKLTFGLANAPGSGSFLTTHRKSDRVIFWKDFKIAASISVPSPSQIVLSRDAKEFIVRCDRTAKIFSLETMQEIKTIPNVISVLGLHKESHLS